MSFAPYKYPTQNRFDEMVRDCATAACSRDEFLKVRPGELRQKIEVPSASCAWFVRGQLRRGDVVKCYTGYFMYWGPHTFYRVHKEDLRPYLQA